ncbi:MAG: ydbC [Pseudonocardiales bacterium]|nr:ydbC [Pseudonocardiales bacterium]
MKTRAIGNSTVGRVEVGAIGFGGMALCVPDTKPRERVVATVRAALDAGVTLIDTADAYGPNDAGAGAQGQNETELAQVLDELGARGKVFIATKGGHVRTDGGGWDTDSSAAHLRASIDDSLRRLGVDQIDLYQHHRPDPAVPYADSIGTIKELFDAGKLRMAGISNANPEQIRVARGILGDALVSVQNQFSPAFTSSHPELVLCDDLGLAFLPWSPLGGISKAGALGERHSVFEEVGTELGVSPQQVALAWELAQSEIVIPIPGASRPGSIADSAEAADLVLSGDQLARLNDAAGLA